MSAPAFMNNLYNFKLNEPSTRSATIHLTWGIHATSELARELYFKRDQADDPKPCRNPSKPSFHLSPIILGHILGLALSNASDDSIAKTLKSVGVETNRVNAKWTGVSLARYKRIVRLLNEAWKSDINTPAIPLVTRLVWEKCEHKSDLVTYFRAVSSHIPGGPSAVFQPSYASLLLIESESALDEFNESYFDVSQLTDESLLSNASRSALESSSSSPAQSIELLVSSMSNSQAFKPAWKLSRHAYQSGKVVPDCVEVCARETMDFILFNPSSSTFDLSRLPSTASPQLRAFYEQFESKNELIRSQEWFNMCQELDGCEYISTTPDGLRQYELFPSLNNMFNCLARVMGRPDWGQGGMRSFISGWNSHLPQDEKYALRGEERREMFRAALSDESRRREIACLKFASSSHYLELTLEGAHRLATAKHGRSTSNKWLMETRADHAKAFLRSKGNHVLASAFWPSLLEDTLLLSPQEELNASGLECQAILCTRWGNDRARWSVANDTFTAERTDQEKRVERLKVEAITLKALDTLLSNPRMDEALVCSLVKLVLNKSIEDCSKVPVLQRLVTCSPSLKKALALALQDQPHLSVIKRAIEGGDLSDLSWLDQARVRFARVFAKAQ